jgi:NTE family protein
VWAFFLGGGGSMGAFAAGAAFYLRYKLDYKFQVVSGVSSGALNATMAAQDKTAEAVKIWYGLKNDDVYTGSVKSITNLFEIIFRGKEGIYSNEPLRQIIDKHVNIKNVKAKLHLGTVALDSGEYLDIIVDNGLVVREKHCAITYDPSVENDIFKKLLLASTCIPVIWPPVMFDDRKLVDGGLRDITPLRSVISHNPSEIIIINCNPREAGNEVIRGVAHIAKRSLGIAMNEIFNDDIREFIRLNDLVKQAEAHGVTLYRKDGTPYKYFDYKIIEPDHDLGNSMDFTRGWDKIVHGVEQARKVFE